MLAVFPLKIVEEPRKINIIAYYRKMSRYKRKRPQRALKLLKRARFTIFGYWRSINISTMAFGAIIRHIDNWYFRVCDYWVTWFVATISTIAMAIKLNYHRN
jgi:hypothetical protein